MLVHRLYTEADDPIPSLHRRALCYLWNPWTMPVRGMPCTGTCDRPVGTLWVIEPCAHPVRVSVFSQGSCRAVLCLVGVLLHACTLSKCAPLDYTLVCVALELLCRCKRLHAVSPFWDCSGQYFPPVCVVGVGTCIPEDVYYMSLENRIH